MLCVYVRTAGEKVTPNHSRSLQQRAICLESETEKPRAAFSVVRVRVLLCAPKLSPRTDGNEIQLSATDVLAPTSMKNAAKCDMSCELQNPVNHQNFERTLHFRVILWSTLVGVSAHPPSPEHACVLQYTCCGGGVWASNEF